MRFAYLVAICTSACVINPPSAQVEASWTIDRLDGTHVGCQPGWVTTQLVTDGAGGRTTDRFECDHGAGLSAKLPEGQRRAWLEFLDAGDQRVATSLPQTVEIETGLVSAVDQTIYLDAGYVSASWSWAGERGCDTSTFNPFLAIHLSLTPSRGTFVFSCHDDSGFTSPIPAGTYQVSIGQGFSSQDLPDIVVTAPNGLTVLPPVVF